MFSKNYCYEKIVLVLRSNIDPLLSSMQSLVPVGEVGKLNTLSVILKLLLATLNTSVSKINSL
jgi:hypothetical protein